jgi:two-component system sensor histidine kinase RegB
MSLVCFGSLFLLPSWPEVVGGHAQMQHSDHMHMHLQGMWVAFAVAAGFIVYFVQRVTRALAEREQQLSEARDLTARNERLASLATLAAGAAHELSTPLSTIAVVAKELEHQITGGGGALDAVADARLIREQVTRCREILVQMTADAGESMGEASEPVPVSQLLQEALGGLRNPNTVQLATDSSDGGQLLVVPRNPVAHAICNVLKNAQEASSGGWVEVRVFRLAGECCIEVSDRGSGMSPEILGRAGEPFFTTKDPGHGMGLGLFLSRAVFTRLGGRIELDSAPGRGTTVRLFLPTERSAPDRSSAGSVNRAA